MSTFQMYSYPDNVVVDEIGVSQRVSEDYEWTKPNNALIEKSWETHTSELDLIKSIISMLPRFREIDYSTRPSDETLFGRVYVLPLEIDPGFITEEREYEIVIWNADNLNIAEFTSVGVVNEFGTDLVAPSLPKNIARGYDEVLDLTILLAGPPIQDTTYTLTIAGYVFEVYITGIRAVEILPEPDWGSNLKIRYRWFTAIASNPRYHKEQRRPLSNTPWRNISASFQVEEYRAEIFINTLKYGSNKVFAVPIYTEQLYVSVLNSGDPDITPTNDYSEFYNLNNNCTHLVIVDHYNFLYEIKEIEAINPSTIDLSSEMAITFDAGKTIIYPAVFSTLSGISMGPETKQHVVVDLNFEEFKKSG